MEDHQRVCSDELAADLSLHNLLSVALENQTPTLTSFTYYSNVAAYIQEFDPVTYSLATELVIRIRDKYRTPFQYLQVASRLPVIKSTHPTIRDTLDGDCAICQKPLRDGGKMIRLRGERDVCGHFFHSSCIGKMQSCTSQPHRCPLCRAKVAAPAEAWADHENLHPAF